MSKVVSFNIGAPALQTRSHSDYQYYGLWAEVKLAKFGAYSEMIGISVTAHNGLRTHERIFSNKTALHRWIQDDLGLGLEEANEVVEAILESGTGQIPHCVTSEELSEAGFELLSN